MPNAVPNTMPNVIPNAMPNAMPNVMPEVIPNIKPNVMPNVIPNNFNITIIINLYENDMRVNYIYGRLVLNINNKWNNVLKNLRKYAKQSKQKPV